MTNSQLRLQQQNKAHRRFVAGLTVFSLVLYGAFMLLASYIQPQLSATSATTKASSAKVSK